MKQYVRTEFLRWYVCLSARHIAWVRSNCLLNWKLNLRMEVSNNVIIMKPFPWNTSGRLSYWLHTKGETGNARLFSLQQQPKELHNFIFICSAMFSSSSTTTYFYCGSQAKKVVSNINPKCQRRRKVICVESFYVSSSGCHSSSSSFVVFVVALCVFQKPFIK